MSKVTVVSRPNRITIASKGVQGAPGPQGEQGIQGPKGDTGDVTPEAIAARDAAQEAASTASTAASTATGAATAASGSASDAAASANLAEQARLLGATIGFATKADMDASLAHPAGTLALVTNDSTAANNVTYRKTGASGSGNWVQSADRVTGLEVQLSNALSNLIGPAAAVAGRAGTPAAGTSYPAGNTIIFSDPVSVSGVLSRVRWSAAAGTTSVSVRVYRHSGANLVVVASQSVATVPGVSEHSVSLAVREGDYIGLYVTGGTLHSNNSATPKDRLITRSGDHTAFAINGSTATATTQLAFGADVTATDRIGHADLELAADHASRLFQDGVQTIGRGVAPVAANNTVNGVYVFATPAAGDGEITQVRTYANATGALTLLIYDLVDGHFLAVGPPTTLALAIGVNTFAVSVAVKEGQYVGVHQGTAGSVSNGLTSDSGGYYYLAGGTPRMVYPSGASFAGNRPEFGITIAYSAFMGMKFVKLTQAQYDALPLKDDRTLYGIV